MYTPTDVTGEVKMRRAMELRILLSSVRELLGQGFELAINNGGDQDECEPTTKLATLKDALYNADEDYVLVHKDGKCIGWLRFIYGNSGWDVLSDYTTNLEALLPKTMALIDKAS